MGSARRVAPRLMAGGGDRGGGIAGERQGGVSPPGRTLPLTPPSSRCDSLGSQGCGDRRGARCLEAWRRVRGLLGGNTTTYETQNWPD